MPPPPPQTSHRPNRLLITGQSGTGKTTYLTRYLRGTPAVCRFIFDAEGELAPALKIWGASDSAGLVSQLRSGWVCFDPSAMFPGNNAGAFDWFAKWSFYASHKLPGRKVWVADELQKYVGTASLTPGVCLVLDTGRRYGLDVAAVAQASNRIHNGVRAQLTEIAAFKTIERRALDWLLDLGMPARIRDLQPGEYVTRNLLTGAEEGGRVF